MFPKPPENNRLTPGGTRCTKKPGQLHPKPVCLFSGRCQWPQDNKFGTFETRGDAGVEVQYGHLARVVRRRRRTARNGCARFYREGKISHRWTGLRQESYVISAPPTIVGQDARPPEKKKIAKPWWAKLGCGSKWASGLRPFGGRASRPTSHRDWRPRWPPPPV